jgi:hypothetical protein
MSQYRTIFLAEILQVHPPGNVANRDGTLRTAVRARAVRVLRNADDQRLTADEFDAAIVQSQTVRPFGRPSTWTGRKIEAGLKYLVFTNARDGLVPAFQTPEIILAITDQEETLADADLILGLGTESIRQQAEAVATVLAHPSKFRSVLMAEFIASLLAMGSASDTAGLRDALEDNLDAAFSNRVQGTLLVRLASRAGSLTHPPENQLHAFVTVAVKRFLSEPNEGGAPLTAAQRGLLDNYLQWILESERASAVMRTGLAPTLRDRLHARIAVLLQGPSLDSEQRSKVGRLSTLLAPN